MSMLDSFFSKGFKAAKCKTLLKLTIPRIKLLRNRREIQLKQMRREIAKLLETGQEATARIRVEHIIREEKMVAAQEIVELFCELIAARLPIIEAQRECPLDLKEAISSICFAAPRCADLPELLQAQMLFAGKYGKEFVAAATELMPECGVNRQLVELLSVRAPDTAVKLKLLKEIAEEHELDWDSSAFESELLKPHEDLLNGPTQFISSSKVSSPEEKHYETKSTTSEPANRENSDSDSDYEIVDFPEVPSKPLQSNKRPTLVPVMLPFPESALSEDDDDEEEESHSSVYHENLPNLQPVMKEEKQFVPFKSPPSQPPSQSSAVFYSSPSISHDNVDLQDILAAAQEAADSAERAATAARSAASIAQLRISELINKKDDQAIENPFHLEKPELDLDQNSDLGSASTSPIQNNSTRNQMSPEPTEYPSYDGDVEPAPYRNGVLSYHQPQRLADEETVFSYPNLFTSQASNLDFHRQSFTDSK